MAHKDMMMMSDQKAERKDNVTLLWAGLIAIVMLVVLIIVVYICVVKKRLKYEFEHLDSKVSLDDDSDDIYLSYSESTTGTYRAEDDSPTMMDEVHV